MLRKRGRVWDPIWDGAHRNPFGAHTYATTVLRDRLYKIPRRERGAVRHRLEELLVCPLPLRTNYWTVWRQLALTARYGRNVLCVALTRQLAAYLLTDRQHIYALTIGPQLASPLPYNIAHWFTNMEFQPAKRGYLARTFADGTRYCVGDGDLQACPTSEFGSIRIGLWPDGARNPGNWIWFRNPTVAVCWLQEVLAALKERPHSSAVRLFHTYSEEVEQFHNVRGERQLYLALYFSDEVAA